MNHRITIELSDRAYGLLLLSEQPLAAAIEEAVCAYYDPPPARWQPLIEAAVQKALAMAPPPPVAANSQPPPIRALAVGDNVQIRDSSSPYFQAIVPITAVGIIRATVLTDHGEQTFLKRDLRYIPPTSPSDEPVD
ncbi:MAG: hypothetical protein ACUVSQ_05530 [Pseudanabaenaceae cyanobacterium]